MFLFRDLFNSYNLCSFYIILIVLMNLCLREIATNHVCLTKDLNLTIVQVYECLSLQC